jgi:hypothetical protein
MFLWVLILEFWFWTETHFWLKKKHDVSIIIEENWYLILDLYLIVNKNLYFIAWNLVWFDVYVVEFEFKCSPLLFVFFIFLDVWYVFLENFMFFVFFLVLICFGLNIYFGLILDSWFSVRLMVELVFSGQPEQVNIISNT